MSGYFKPCTYHRQDKATGTFVSLFKCRKVAEESDILSRTSTFFKLLNYLMCKRSGSALIMRSCQRVFFVLFFSECFYKALVSSVIIGQMSNNVDRQELEPENAVRLLFVISCPICSGLFLNSFSYYYHHLCNKNKNVTIF